VALHTCGWLYALAGEFQEFLSAFTYFCSLSEFTGVKSINLMQIDLKKAKIITFAAVMKPV
jgi:hypothetical protein